MATSIIERAVSIPTTIKMESLATGSGSDEGFVISFGTNTSATVLYVDNRGAVAQVYRTGSGQPTINIISGSLTASATDATNAYLRHGAYTRAMFIIASTNPYSINVFVYGA